MSKYPRPFYDRLRKPVSRAIRKYSTPDSLPVLFFGDIFKAKVATVSVNPGSDLGRLKNLIDLGASGRESLTEQQCNSAIEVMEEYFESRGEDLGPFWRRLERVLKGIGVGYGRNGGTVHLDMVQESTTPRWGKLPSEVRAALRESDSDFSSWMLRYFPLQVLVCNGASTFKAVLHLIQDVESRGSDTLGGLTWSVSTGVLDRRVVGVVGWNKPLGRAGLSRDEEEALGVNLRDRLRAHRISPVNP